MREEDRRDNKDEMLQKIKEYNFSVIELALYLNTHPKDEKALYLHNRYSKELEELKEKYQKVYGPLTIYYPSDRWNWVKTPWPWEDQL